MGARPRAAQRLLARSARRNPAGIHGQKFFQHRRTDGNGAADRLGRALFDARLRTRAEADRALPPRRDAPVHRPGIRPDPDFSR